MDTSEGVRRIQGLDLEPIKFKLVHGDGESGWTIAKADQVEIEYKRFLVLNLKNHVTGRRRSIVPTGEVDKFWHTHILDTAKYGVDCEFCLGFFLHHFPYLGLRGPEDARKLQDRFQESREYYLAEFGEYPADKSGGADCDPSDCAPVPSCSGEPDPAVMSHNRPVLART